MKEEDYLIVSPTVDKRNIQINFLYIFMYSICIYAKF